MKKYFTVIIVLLLCISTVGISVTAKEKEKAVITDPYYANILSELGVFKGSSLGFELDREPTRIEGLIMLIRLLGKEEEALSKKYEASFFKDVPSWAVSYVNYAYEQGLTKGAGNGVFGTETKLDVKDYMTFVLRSLGYNDQKGDFSWSGSITKAREVGIIAGEEVYLKDIFTRGDVAKLSFLTLKAKMKGQDKSLAQSLIDKGLLKGDALSKLVVKYSPMDFGAAGNGIKDDTFAFTNLFGAAVEMVYLQDGTYNLAGKTITLEKPLTIMGPGKIINGKMIVKNVNGFTLYDIKTENFSMVLKNVSNMYIKKSAFSNVKDDAEGFITIAGYATDIGITGNTFSNIQYLTSPTAYGAGVKVNALNTEMKNIVISENTFEQIHGPAAIWLGGSNSKYNEVTIASNTIHDTASFGIELFRHQGDLLFSKTNIHKNTIYNIGSIRKVNYGNGCGGIYNNLHTGDIYAYDNNIKNVLEVGIEGYFTKIENNYIEDTGADQLNRPITDSAGIYATGLVVRGNTIVNPGYYGGIHQYSSGVISGMEIEGNTIKNVFNYWKANTNYKMNDLVVINGAWYRCIKAGISATVAPSGKKGSITDGTALWDYKKPFSQIGIHLNAEKGIENFKATNNKLVNFPVYFYLSGLNKNVTIKDNKHDVSGLTFGEVIDFLTGYGSRKGENVTVVK